MTWDYTFANVSPVPGSARQPGPKDRVFGATPSGRARRKTTSAHEAEATSDGARSHAPKRRAPGFPERRAEGQLRCTETPVRRWPRTAEYRSHGATGAPQLLSRSPGPRRHRRWHGKPGQRERRRGRGPGNRTRVQLRRRRSGNRPTEPGWHRRRVTGGGAERLRAGQPAAGPTTGIARRASGHDGRCVGRAKANARRSTSGGSSHLSGSPGWVRRRKQAAPPGATHFFGRVPPVHAIAAVA